MLIINLNFLVEDGRTATGSSNLLVEHGMEHAYQKFFGKKTKESLSSFLTQLPGSYIIIENYGNIKLVL